MHIRPHLFSGIVILSIISFFAPVASAQSSADIVGWYRRAQVMERTGRPEQALELYRQIWDADPNRFDVVLRAADILDAQDRNADALSMLEQAVARSPQTSQLWVEYGDTYYRMGNPVAADSVWMTGDATVKDRFLLLIAVTDRLTSHDDLEGARSWAQRGADAAEDPAIFYRRLFSIALTQPDPAQAAEYAVRYAGDDPDRANQLVAEVENAELPPDVFDVLYERAADIADTLDRAGAHALAGNLALDVDDAALADRHLVRTAQLDPRGLPAVLNAAEFAASEGYPLIAAHLHEVVTTRFGGSPAAQRSAITAARILAEAGEDDRAARLFRWILQTKSAQYSEEANLGLADILARTGNTSEARNHYRVVEDRPRSARAANRAEFGLAEVALREHDFPDAEARWTRLAETASAEAQAARLRLAELALYRGQASIMNRWCGELVGEEPDSDEANNCLALTGTISAARGDSVAWKRFGRLRYHHDLGNTDSVYAVAQELAATPLAGEALLVVAETHLRAGESDAAQGTYADLAQRFQGSSTGEEAVWRLAELRRSVLNEGQAALVTYEQLLREYPQSVYVISARKWIRELRRKERATS